MDQEEQFYLHALRSLPPVGDKTLRKLVERFGSAQNAWERFAPLEGLGTAASEALMNRRALIDPGKAWAHLEKEQIRVFHADDPFYPRPLREIPDHPLILYVRGNYDWSRLKPAIAIVGSRKFSPYGEQAAERLAYDLAQAGCAIVSGLAFGVDKAAHMGALEASGDTLAVLASGIDNAGISPRSHYNLGQQVLANGALVSEFPPGSAPLKASFLLRNRIIAGLTQGTIVVEAAEHSGSLVTASLALDYDREVFAVPGSIFSPSSQGTNALLRRGAKLVTRAYDVLEELSLAAPASEASLNAASDSFPDFLSAEARTLFRALSHEPLHINQILKATALSPAQAQSSLSLLELSGLAKNIGGMQYIRL